MIAFDLRCNEHHTFEAWFRDRKAYEEQKEQGLIVCPACGSREVEKILSPVSVRTSSSAGMDCVTDGPDAAAGLMKVMKKVYRAVLENTEDVGVHFTSQALKMHYGVTEPRNIRGVATMEEEKVLKDEGIEFSKIPVPARVAKKEDIN